MLRRPGRCPGPAGGNHFLLSWIFYNSASIRCTAAVITNLRCEGVRGRHAASQKKRLLTAAIGLPVLVAAVAVGGWPWWILLGAASVVGMEEFFGMVGRPGPVLRFAGFGLGIASVVGTAFYGFGWLVGPPLLALWLEQFDFLRRFGSGGAKTLPGGVLSASVLYVPTGLAVLGRLAPLETFFILAVVMGVVTFSLGFGPKLAGFTRGATRYVLSLIPLGGYVQLVAQDPDEEAPEQFPPETYFRLRPAWQRIIVVAAGPLFNFILAWLLFWGLLLVEGRFEMLPVIGQVQKDSPAELAGLRAGDTVSSIGGTPVTNWDELAMLFDAALKFLSQARGKILERDFAQKGILISKALDILAELQSTLNPHKGGEMAQKLKKLYLYCSSRLLRANRTMGAGAWAKTGLKVWGTMGAPPSMGLPKASITRPR